MLDSFLKIAYQKKSAQDARNEMASAMRALPTDELRKIASGELKLSCGSGRSGWIDQFEGTPMYEEALSLEEQDLQLEAADIQRRMDNPDQDIWKQRDALALQRRLLELKLRQAQHGGGGEEEGLEEEPVEEVPEEMPAEEKAASALEEFSKLGFAQKIEAMQKEAFSVTERGHQVDAAMAGAKREHALEQARILQRENAIGHRDPKTGKNPAKFFDTLRMMASTPYGPLGHPTSEARQAAYVQAKHEAGKNAWNPLGGTLTPLPEEEGATPGLTGMLGRVKDKEKKSSVSPELLAEMQKEALSDIDPRQYKGQADLMSALEAAGGVGGGIGGAVTGGRIGFREGKRVGKPIVGALGGASIGGLGGGTVGRVLGRTMSSPYALAQHVQARQAAEQEDESKEKKSSVSPELIAEMRKEAIAGAMLAGAKGLMGGVKALGARGAGAFQGARKGGAGVLQAGQAAAKGVGRGVKPMVQQAGQWASKNPGAAAGLGAAGLGAAGLTGAAIS